MYQLYYCFDNVAPSSTILLEILKSLSPQQTIFLSMTVFLFIQVLVGLAIREIRLTARRAFLKRMLLKVILLKGARFVD